MDRVKKRFRSLNTKPSDQNLVDTKPFVRDEDGPAVKTTEYLTDSLQRVSSPTVGPFEWESEPFPRASDNDKGHAQSPTTQNAHQPGRRDGRSGNSQNLDLTSKKSVYRPPWLPKAENAPASVFDLLIDPLKELNTSDNVTHAHDIMDRKRGGEPTIEEDPQSYDLRPPAIPKRYSLGIENTVDLLYGEAHLQSILNDKKLRGEFATFLAQRMPSQMVHMTRLAENEKAIAAITYANAISQSQRPLTGAQQPSVAALVSDQFQQDGQRTFGMLLAEALPAYIAHALTLEVMRYMEKQIPRMRTLHMDQQPVKGISEVFCLTDPNVKDHPIIYASKEFFRLTQYGRDYAIGRNCRFLQGPKTASDSVFRLGRAIRDGREVCETILNYRRDGSPFLNLLLMAPLRDDRGNIKYFLGAQVDVSGIVKDCPGLEAAHRRVAMNQEPAVEPQTSAQAADSIPARHSSRQSGSAGGSKPRHGNDRVRTKLRAFLEKLSADEIAILRESSKKSPESPTFSLTPSPEARTPQHQPNRKASSKSIRLERQYLSDEDPVLIVDNDHQDGHGLPAATTINHTTNNTTIAAPSPPAPTGALPLLPSALAGPLPGVYQNYLLVRPAPSLNILFASPSLMPSHNLTTALTTDLRQTPLLSHISTSANTLAGLQKAFAQGIPVTGRVVWRPAPPATLSMGNRSSLTAFGNGNGGGSHASWQSGHEALGGGTVSVVGQSQWLSATPLVGSDDRVGVWVVVIIKAPYGSAVGEMY